MIETTKRGRLKSFGLDWKVGPRAWYAKATKQFWEEWERNKEQIKAAGFWVAKGNMGYYVYQRHENVPTPK